MLQLFCGKKFLLTFLLSLKVFFYGKRFLSFSADQKNRIINLERNLTISHALIQDKRLNPNFLPNLRIFFKIQLFQYRALTVGRDGSSILFKIPRKQVKIQDFRKTIVSYFSVSESQIRFDCSIYLSSERMFSLEIAEWCRLVKRVASLEREI